ncbi:hypothetical protein HZS55_15660 [Halosimplex rubrum]|uniref:Uncharacterized protein n=1 Tax=Halosimplex rubrum TaxID=869889 RepID=A0A7D5TDY1_9EURY|nr:hypothetical protein [Halosimplex rubrum]QLH78636.1 hypothetical protein HZS55_15660 [Halosimplex rubrum]
MNQLQRQPYDVEPFDPDEDDVDEWLEAHRDALEYEAASDAPDAWVFERALAYVESGEVSSS